MTCGVVVGVVLLAGMALLRRRRRQRQQRFANATFEKRLLSRGSDLLAGGEAFGRESEWKDASPAELEVAVAGGVVATGEGKRPPAEAVPKRMRRVAVKSSNVGKYALGSHVSGLGDGGSVSGEVVDVLPDGAGTTGPGRIVVAVLVSGSAPPAPAPAPAPAPTPAPAASASSSASHWRLFRGLSGISQSESVDRERQRRRHSQSSTDQSEDLPVGSLPSAQISKSSTPLRAASVPKGGLWQKRMGKRKAKKQRASLASSSATSGADVAAASSAPTHTLQVRSSNVGKYKVGSRVNGLGDGGSVSGEVVDVLPDGDGATGPGRIVVLLDLSCAASQQLQEQGLRQEQGTNVRAPMQALSSVKSDADAAAVSIGSAAFDAGPAAARASSARVTGAKAASPDAHTHTLQVRSSNVGKYKVGSRVNGLGDGGSVSGEVVDVLPDGDGATGPGRIVVLLDLSCAASQQLQEQGLRQEQGTNVRAPTRTKKAKTGPREAVRFSEAQIVAATGGFDPANLLDEGTMGCVYRGEMGDGVGAVAIKVLKRQAANPATTPHPAGATPVMSTGESSFRVEAKALGAYRHANIVQLVGHCFADDQGGEGTATSSNLPKFLQRKYRQGKSTRKGETGGGGSGVGGGPLHCLVFEFMEGGSLQMRLGAPRPAHTAAGLRLESPPLPPGTNYLTWQQRLTVASDVTRGLEYLHTEFDTPTIHQDVKSANVLLTLSADGVTLTAKLADFGTARFAPRTLAESGAHHSTKLVVGTTPYMWVMSAALALPRMQLLLTTCPCLPLHDHRPMEYITLGHVSEKTDTYALGVVLLELLTGKLAGNPLTGELLSTEMTPVVNNAARLLPPLLDEKALPEGSGGWGAKDNEAALKEALSLAEVARACLDPSARKRCTAAAVLPRLDALAGRMAARRAGRGNEYDPQTGKLVPKAPKPLSLAHTGSTG